MKTVKEIKEQGQEYQRLVEYMQTLQNNPAHSFMHNEQEYTLVPKKAYDILMQSSATIAFEVFRAIDMIETKAKRTV